MADLVIGFVFGHWVGNSVWFWWNWKGFIVNEVLDLMSEAEAIVGIMAGHLVVVTKGIWVVVSREFFGQFTRFKRFDKFLFEELLVDRG